MRARGRLRPALIVCITAVGLSIGCSGAPSGSVGATLELVLASPAQDDGAVLFTLSGGPVDALEAASSNYAIYSSRPDPSTLRVIVTGDVGSGPIARIHIPDESRIPQYSASIQQIAARATYTQRAPDGYSLTLIP
jgi:hypothetical protein